MTVLKGGVIQGALVLYFSIFEIPSHRRPSSARGEGLLEDSCTPWARWPLAEGAPAVPQQTLLKPLPERHAKGGQKSAKKIEPAPSSLLMFSTSRMSHQQSRTYHVGGNLRLEIHKGITFAARRFFSCFSDLGNTILLSAFLCGHKTYR